MAWNQMLGGKLKESSLDKVRNAAILCAKLANSSGESAFWAAIGEWLVSNDCIVNSAKWTNLVASWVIVGMRRVTGLRIVLGLASGRRHVSWRELRTDGGFSGLLPS